MRGFLRLNWLYVAITCLFSIPFVSQTAYASHAVGIDLTYQCLGGNQYEFTVNFYRDCDGISAPSNAFITISSASCGINTSTSLPRVNFMEVSAICPSQLGSTACNGGNLPGIQQYTYRGNFTLPANCTDWVVSYTECCRNSAITNLQNPGSQNLYVEANLNNAGGLCNNSPFFTSLPTPYLCSGQPFFYNHGAIDIDGDSLVYTLIQPRTARTGNIPYTGGYSPTNPMATSGGFGFNNQTGQMSFTPSGQQQAVVTIRVDEYRNGVLIGSVVRDLQLVVINCSNQLPTASGINGTSGVGGAYDISVCAGFPLCFDITSNDGNAGQNVTMQWNGGVQGATFTSSGSPFPRATFCWTPGPADIGTHSFSLEVRDNACPIPGLNIYTYTINVTPNPNPPVTAGPDRVICQGGSTNLSASTAATGVTYAWSPSAGLSCTNCPNPVASPNLTTVYTVTASYPDGCSGTDDVRVTVNPTPTVSVFPAAATICTGGAITLTATGSANVASYQWNPGALTGATVTVSPASTTTYTVTAFDAFGCPSAPATSVITLNPPPAAPVCNNIYVTTNGSGNGLSQSSPTTLQNALIIGACNSVNIKMAIGTYLIDSAITNFTSYMTIEGGFDPGNGWRKTSLPGATTIVRTNNNPDGPLNAPRIVAFYLNTAQYFRFQDLTIQTQDAQSGSISNYVMHLTSCSNYEIVRTRLICGKGGDGLPGSNALVAGADGADGAAGSNGNDDNDNFPGPGGNGGNGGGANGGAGGAGGTDSNGGSCCQNGPPGQAGAQGAAYSAGGGGGGGATGGEREENGGRGGAGSGLFGGGATPLGGTGGAGDDPGTPGNNGISGTNGVNGANGANGAPGTFTGGFFMPGGNGADGGRGQGGSGGSGGGGGGGHYCNLIIIPTCEWGAGNGGGGGGGGGEGGNGGEGGGAGGASIALYLFNNGPNGNIRQCNITPGAAGVGGVGGLGSAGGQGGAGGIGANSTPGEIGRGGDGGWGGVGGRGGTGGTGANGISRRYYKDGGINPVTTDTLFNLTAQPTITVTNVSCTNTNVTYGAAASGNWTLGSGSAPATATGASAVTQYSTTGRKDIGYAGNAYTGFHNIAISNTAFVPDIIVQNATMVNPTTYRICAGSAVNYRTSSLAVGYDWNLQGVLPSNYTTQNVLNVIYLTPGTYTATLRVNTDCCGWSQTTSVTMIVDSTPNLAFSGLRQYCEGGQTTITASGASSYVWTPNTGISATTGSTVTITTQTTTTYVVYGYNSAGTCQDVDSFTITVNPDPVLATSSVAATCGSNGSVSVSVTPPGTYIYQWNTTPPQNTATASNVSQGNYQISVTNPTTGCSAIAYQTVAANGTPIAYITGVANVSCFGGNNGAAQAAVTGGTGPYTYAWSGGGSGANRTNLTAGTYTVTVTDANGCTATAIAYINEPTQLIAPITSTPATCAGNPDGTIIVAPDGGAGNYQLQWNTNPVQTNDTLLNLPPGAYTVTVTDANGCTLTRSASITSPPPFIITQNSLTNISCGGTNGAITITAIGGTGQISYSLDNGPTQTTGAFPSVGPGAHVITITDANGCDTTYNFTLNTPTPFSISTTVNPIGCSGGTTGSVTVNGSGGTGILNYNVNGGPFGLNNTFNLLPAGTYIFAVRDQAGCILRDTVVLAAPGSLAVALTQDSVTCNGDTDGGITAVGSGGTSPYRFSLSGGPALQTTGTFTGLAAGSYTVTITDFFNCTATSTISVLTPGVLTANLVQDSIDCNGGTDGSITATGTGGTAPYEYSIDGTNFGPSGVFTNLAPGPYTITIRDANGCTGTNNITVIQPAPLAMNPIITDLLCPSDPTGVINTNPTGGTAPYRASLSNGPFVTPPNFQGLTVGTYTLIVRDNKGCEVFDTVSVGAPGGVTISLVQTPVSCTGTLGSITATAAGGVPGQYFYSLDGGNLGTVNTFGSLPAGWYTVTAYDVSGCFAEDSIEVLDAANVQITLAVDSAQCFGQPSGQITATVGGVTAGYTFNINGGGYTANNVFSNLPAGPYTIGVQDANGCGTTTVGTVLEPAEIVVSSVVVDVSCFGSTDGSVTFTASGGTAPYEYSTGSGFGTSNIISNLSPNAYPNAAVRDSRGCSVSTPFTINEPAAMTLTLVQDSVSCNGLADGTITATATGGDGNYEYSINGGGSYSFSDVFPNLAAGPYTIIVRDGNGCTATASTTVLQPAVITLTLNAGGSACAGGSGQVTATTTGGNGVYEYSLGGAPYTSNNVFSNLAANTYTITVRDQNGCSATDNITVPQPTGLVVNAVQDSASCGGVADGSITVTASGGTPNYQYSLDGVNFVANNVFTSLAAGPYVVTVEDGNNCQTTFNINVREPDPVTISLVQDSANCAGAADGSITVTAGGGSPAYEYSIDGVNFVPNNVFNGLAAASYTLIVEDANGCQAQDAITVLEPTALVLVSAVPTDVSCNSTNDGTITITATGGSLPYSYDLNSGTPSSNNVFSTLTAATYTVNVTDNNGCVQTTTATVGQASTIVVSLVADSVTCAGAADGQITVTATGGAGTLEYSINNGPFGPSNVFTGLAGASYNIVVRDASLCLSAASITVGEPLPLTATAVQDSVNCNGGNDGSITVTASGGSPAFTYTLNAGAPVATNVFSNLSASANTVLVTDGNGCTASVNITVLEPAALTISAVANNANCSGGGGDITVTAGGGSPAYEYSIDGSTFGTSNTFANVAPGPYTVTLRDANGCTATQNVTIAQPGNLTLTLVQDSVSCNGLADGVITATAGGGSGVYEYSTDGTNFGPSNIFSNLAAGPYTVTLRDDVGCTTTQNITVEQPAVLAINPTVIDISCNSTNDGQIDVAASGGSAPYQYSFNGGAYGSNTSFTSLTANTYTLAVQDANGCSANTTANVQQAAAVTITLTQDSVNCNGGTDGQIVAVGAGGSGTLRYSINGGALVASGTFTGLGIGTYTIRVEDIAGCFATDVIDVLQPTALTVSAVQDSANCAGAADGFVTATASGGSPAYQYSRDGANFAPSGTITGLAAGPYTITARDANGCTATTNVTVLQPAAITTNVTATNISCNGGNNGTATVVANGGSQPLTYSWNNGGGTAATTSNRGAGWAVVTVTDRNGCVRRDSAQITEPTAIAITETITPLSCGGGNTASISLNVTGGTGAYTYQWSNAQNTASITGLGAGPYSVVVTDANNCTATESYTIAPPGSITLSATSVGVDCYNTATGSATASVQGATGAVTYQWSNAQTTATATGLLPGSYDVTATDAAGCFATATVVVANAPEFTASLTPTDPRCYDTADGSLVVSTTGGTGNVSYTWSHNGGLNNATAGGLSQGSYSVTVSDANNCSVVLTQQLTSPSQLFVSLSASADTVKFGETVQLTATPGSGVIGTPNYEWTPSDNLSCTDCDDPVAGPLVNGSYSYTVRIADDNGCDATAQVFIIVDLYDRVLYVPNAFTPNGDGLNDEFNIYGNGFNEVLFQVFNRWGEKMYETTDPTKGWDGTFKGEPMPPGVYVYQVTAYYLDGQEGYAKGSVTLIK